jgi:hypothetical protein
LPYNSFSPTQGLLTETTLEDTACNRARGVVWNKKLAILKREMQRPQYVDSQSGQVFDTSNANFEGWLTKQSVWLKDWRRRFTAFFEYFHFF